jgi:Type IV secretion system pilin
MDSIPAVIISVINVLLGVAGTVAVVALIYYAVQMQLASGITGDSSKVDNAKKGMTGALIGFVVAILAWFIVIRFVEILSSVS